MFHDTHPSAHGGPGSEPDRPEAPRIAGAMAPVHRPGQPIGHAPATVRVISASEGAQRKAENDPSVASPDERRRAAERFEQARAAHAAARGRLVTIARLEAEAHRKADAALDAYQEARGEARRATVVLRQRQRQAAGTKLAMRRALEWVARLEALDDDLGAARGDERAELLHPAS